MWGAFAMPTFSYTARRPSGETVTSKSRADNVKALRDELFRNGLLLSEARELRNPSEWRPGNRLVSKMVKMPTVEGDANTGTSTNEPANGSTNSAGKQPWGWVNGNGGNGLGAAKHASGPDVYESDQYYFHPDHLGWPAGGPLRSAAPRRSHGWPASTGPRPPAAPDRRSPYVTDIDGEIFQHLEYFPFGESFVVEQSNTQRTPYLFTAKELDEVVGRSGKAGAIDQVNQSQAGGQLYYFGARYCDPRTSVWQSGEDA